MNQADEILNQIDVRVFLGEFLIENELLKLRAVISALDVKLATRLLELVAQVKQTEGEFKIGTVKHPLAQHHSFADVQTIELSERCFRLSEWQAMLGQKFPDLESRVIQRTIERFVYFRHLR